MPKGSESSVQEISQSFDADFAVKAWQNVPNMEHTRPEWLTEALELGAVRPYPDARDNALQLVTPYGKPKVESGDWIVLLPSNRMVIWPNGEFQQDFIADAE